MKSANIAWDDLRFVLALSRVPTMAEAAQSLRVHQSTVSRRVHALESHLGVKIFTVGEAGIVMTEAGRAMSRRAARIEELASDLEVDFEADRVDDRQSVRISAVSTFITGFLNQHAGEFLTAHPNIRLDFVGEERNAVLERGEADIAIRHARPTTGGAITRKLADLGTAIYAAPAFVAGTGHLIDDVPWVGFSRPLDYLPEQQWIDSHIPARNVVMTLSAASSYANAVTQGIGAGLLGCLIGEQDSRVTRIEPHKPVLYRESWLMVLDDTRRRSAVRSVITWLTELCQTHKHKLLGETPG